MKKVIKKVTASTNLINDKKMYTPSDILELLLQMECLKNYNIAMAETIDGDIEYMVGDYKYKIGH